MFLRDHLCGDARQARASLPDEGLITCFVTSGDISGPALKGEADAVQLAPDRPAHDLKRSDEMTNVVGY
jgi:hypothetical protein